MEEYQKLINCNLVLQLKETVNKSAATFLVENFGVVI